MDWQLCSKPASVRPQDLCELNESVALAMFMQKECWRMVEKRETDRRKHTDALQPPARRPKRLGFSVLIVSGGRLLAECTVSRLVPRLLLASRHLISTSHPHLYFSYSSVFPLLSPSLPPSLPHPPHPPHPHPISASYIKKHISIMFTDQAVPAQTAQQLCCWQVFTVSAGF